jgi:hypothetical protein
MKKALLLLLLVCANQILHAQTYTYVKQVSPEEKKQFLGLTTKIFKLNNNFSINLSNSDAEMSIKDISDQIQYNDAYLEKNLKALKKDSLNPYFSNNLAMYYEDKQNTAMAREYFKKSLRNSAYFVTVKKDSAQFYSFRGLVRFHLGEKDPILDIEKAIKINSNDSIADTFYPIFLINAKRLADLREYSTKKLESAPKYPSMSFVMLYYSYFLERMSAILSENNRELYAQKEYDEILDYKFIDKYADQYKNNQQIQNLRSMIDVSALFIKMMFFKQNENGTAFILNFSEREKAKIAALQIIFQQSLTTGKINAYAGNKCLSVLNYMQGKPQKAIEYAQLAIASLPRIKQSSNFNNNEMFDLLLCTYYGQNDFTNYNKVLDQKFEKEVDKSGLSNDYLNRAIIYLYQNNVEKCDEWCRKAKAINSESFEGLRLMSHLYFLNDSSSLSNYYGESASKKMESDMDSAYLSLQFGVYMIINGDAASAQSAYENIAGAKKSLKGDCVLCDDLLSKYFKVNP